MDWTKKRIGKPGEIPEICPICGYPMSERGWEVIGEEILCNKCQTRFHKGERYDVRQRKS